MSILNPASSRGTSAPDASASFDGRPGRPARPLGARPAVVQPRAIVGALLVVLAVVGTYAAIAGSRQAPSDTFVVARRALEPGTVITADDVVVRTGELPGDVRDRVFGSVEALRDAVTLGPLQPNDVVVRSSVRLAADGVPLAREVSVPVDQAQVAGRIRGGDLVDLIGFRDGEQGRTRVVARQLKVLQVRTGDEGVGTNGRAVLTVNVEDEEQACALAEAMHADKITLVRVTGVPVTTAPEATRSCTAPSGAPALTPEQLAFFTTTTTTPPPPPTTARAEAPTTRREPPTTRPPAAPTTAPAPAAPTTTTP